MNKIIYIIILLIFTNISVDAQHTFFKSRDFGKYILADHYSPNMQINTGLGLNLADYNIDSERKSRYVYYNETIVGGEIPIYNYRSKRGKNRFSVSMPISFSVWFDFTENYTAPILNTDYRFAPLEFNFFRKFSGEKFKNVTVKFQPFFHESTHIGDELTISRMNDSLPVTRVNVSYETYNISLMINDPMDKVEKNHSFKLGARILINGHRGWYSISSYEGDTTLFDFSSEYADEGRVRTKYWVEPYFQYQYQDPEAMLSFGKTMFTVSIDNSLRVKHGYPFEVDGKERKQELYDRIISNEFYAYSGNFLFGWQFYDTNKELSGLGIYARFYLGLNYHGQFRNIPLYNYMGMTIIYSI